MKKPENIAKTIKTKLIKALEEKINNLLKSHAVEDVILSALSNCLIRRCIKLKVPKDVFMTKLSDGWDYHADGKTER